MTNKDTVIIQCNIDKKLIPFLKIVSEALFVAPMMKITEIEELIEDEKYSDAKKLIEKIEKEYGKSVFTVCLTVKINRIEVLGE